ncbi:MAG: HDOD domain-containing protein [Gammaproteobacteria bacterium]|uniref:HDOD domain-containing protein n=1 Tax=Pseudomaricurvus alcaniphilus TaxID=1166482 RepID=UPI0014072430|nr:HDOD domain-containing protein [Pseudomaricurvus alcaniphilus]MBR9911757.1 HDOD domain-containing protein [Gammaproteobacteria bacterium]NHN39177.1 HDOD domain-containing protein [Pseudomaricurvus alcaniphilus]
MPAGGDAIQKELAGSKLPPLPHVLVELLRACQDQSSSFQDMAKIVANDAVIAAQLIMVANTSYYSRKGNVATIERALLLLGTDTLKTMAITASVQQMCDGFLPTDPAYYKSYWKRSLRCALIAKALAHLTSFSSPDEAYLIGLLHNIGELVLAVNHTGAYPELLTLVNGGSQAELENTRFQTNHCELGSQLARQWGLDAFAADAIAYHHEAVNEVVDAHHLTKIIFLAAKLADEPLHAALDDEAIELAGIEAAERLFDLSGALAREIAAKVTDEVSRIADALAIDLQGDEHQDMAEMKSRLGQQLQRRLVNQEMSTMLQSSAEAQAVAPETLSQAVNIMFGYRQTLLLEFARGQNALLFQPPAASAGAIAIALSSSGSLVAACAKAGEVMWSHAPAGNTVNLTVVDRQLLRLCGGQAMVCVPVSAGGQLQGVLVMGDASNTPPDGVSLALLKDFAGHVATLLSAKDAAQSAVDDKVLELQEKVRAVVHEANNPLTIIRNYLEALSGAADAEDDDSSGGQEYRILREEVDRASQILMRLQDLEQDAAEAPAAMSLNQEIKALVTVFQQSICRTSKVECKLRLSPKLDAAVFPRNQLRQIVTNLVKNAVEAMPRGGEIRISTALVTSSDRGKSAEIIIADNGPGLPDQIVSNLFKPGYSTKDGYHSGLGLSITRSLVEEVGGLISCQSGERGTQFRVVIPMA